MLYVYVESPKPLLNTDVEQVNNYIIPSELGCDIVPAGMCCASHKINNHGTNLTGIAYTSLLANIFNYGRF